MFLFGKKKQNQSNSVLKAYVTGKCIPIEEVKDDVFSKKMMGDGLAIVPEEGTVVAPCDATVTALFEKTNHAIGLTMDNGLQILIHCGLDTVNIKGNMFNCSVKKDAKVKQGDVLIQFDKNQMKELGYDDTIIMVILDPGKVQDLKFETGKAVEKGVTQVVTYK